METVSLNQYLSKSNVWALRLLGFETFSKVRDISQVEKEYNLDKYARLVDLELPTIEHYKKKEFEQGGTGEDDQIFFSLKEEIFSVKLSLARKIYYQIIKEQVEKYGSEYFCELGCGYGFNLSYLDGMVYGGEYSENAVKIAEKMGMDVRNFNYYHREDYSFIRDGSTVFTVHSLEQIPDARCFVEGIASQREKVRYVVNIEPSFIDERTTLFGLLCNRYIEMNDYNRNLFSLLRERDDIEILEYERDVVGLNPLNSANIIVWRFR